MPPQQRLIAATITATTQLLATITPSILCKFEPITRSLIAH